MNSFSVHVQEPLALPYIVTLAARMLLFAMLSQNVSLECRLAGGHILALFALMLKSEVLRSNVLP